MEDKSLRPTPGISVSLSRRKPDNQPVPVHYLNSGKPASGYPRGLHREFLVLSIVSRRYCICSVSLPEIGHVTKNVSPSPWSAG